MKDKDVVLKSRTYEFTAKTGGAKLSGTDAREALIQAIRSIPENELHNVVGSHITVIL
ncbi:MAG TPA: hypothetical protein VF469_37780 [Kofleriaceae bacterium]